VVAARAATLNELTSPQRPDTPTDRARWRICLASPTPTRDAPDYGLDIA
jgi:hypothetical protein